ncbi:DUF6961 family protein [Sphingobium sp. TCM1]|jgi:hypothetical protein|uniref:DUF6961 family protein n=1 Tax=Sphingobium sp. TCM1 TaxID=453246 RepID=UPI001E519CF8|nr:hypothetical protein [Sphingobium sp. TCM1]
MEQTTVVIDQTWSPMTAEQEHWAEALWVEKRWGDKAAEHIATRVTSLAIAGDEAGVERWIAIASRYDQLQMECPGQKH